MQSINNKKISAVINTINEERNIKRAITSLDGLADEVVVVDMHSSDNTVSIAKSLGARVFDFEPVGYVEPARNFAISKAANEWVLIIDADEKVSRGLSKKLKEIVLNPDGDYYRIPRKNIIFGKWLKHARWWPDYNIRFFRKGYVSWNETIHSVPVTTGTGFDIVDSEDTSIIHYHYDSIEEYIERMNRYTTMHANNKIKSGYIFSWSDLIIAPINEFVSRYFFGSGYLDGLHGLVVSGLQSFSEFTLYAKIWKLSGKNKNPGVTEVIAVIKRSLKDLYYWQADTLVKEKGGIINIIKRKFKLP